MNTSATSPNETDARGRGGVPRVVIVGAGSSGLGLAIKLKQAGFDNFRILEKSDDMGGTWLDNRYPGCGCDVPAPLYSFSFALKPDWSRRYPPQAETLAYLRDCVDRFDIRSHIRFGTAVESARFDEANGTWRIRTADGEQLVADVFVSATGQLSRPKIPEFEGLTSFQGNAFHTARWDPGFDVSGRDIAVVGNGASAIQVIPAIADHARNVYVFQRSPNWVTQRNDYRYPHFVKSIFRRVPGVARLYRWWTYLLHEWRIIFYGRNSWLNRIATGAVRWQMQRKLPERLWDPVIPAYPVGSKRILLSSNYLETLSRDNVHLVTREVRGMNATGVVTDAGTTPVDAVVFATGFYSNEFLYPMEIYGRNGARLHDVWKDRPKTYLGLMAAGFPNLFMLYGPNTNLGHNSIIFMIECQVGYVMQCLRAMARQGNQTIEVTDSAVGEFDCELQQQLRGKVWNAGVTNWYKNPAGYVVNNWGRSTVAYWLKTRKPDLSAFQFQNRGPDTGTPDTGTVHL